MTDECPHCGAEDFADVGAGTPRICLSCGYDDDHGTTGVCPGGLHPRDSSGPCCPACWKRAPRNLGPADPRWRSRLRWYRRCAKDPSLHHLTRVSAQREADRIEAALLAWLAEHPAE